MAASLARAAVLVAGVIHSRAAMRASKAALMFWTMFWTSALASGEKWRATYIWPTASPREAFVEATARFQRSDWAEAPVRAVPWNEKRWSTNAFDRKGAARFTA